MNPKAARFRLYLLTRMGWQCRLIVIGQSDSKRGPRRLPLEFWRLYAEMLYPHRSAVIRTLIRPMQAAEIKRRASLSDSNLRISAGNVREVLKYLLEKGIVHRFSVPRSAYGTSLHAGLEQAEAALDWSQSDIVRRMVMITDGHGGKPFKIADDLKDRGTVIDVIGVGRSPRLVNEKVLKRIASVVEGELRYRFVRDSATLIAHYTALATKTATATI